jgi:pimeloyl-ACP methyl ester carboxylesterase
MGQIVGITVKGDVLTWPKSGHLINERDTAMRYRSAVLDGTSIFYREAGPTDAPAVLLLHGFPSSSHMFRDLIPVLAEDYRVIAPDMPGFGFSDAPDHKKFDYTFAHLAELMNAFTEAVGLRRFALYVFDYGAPVGFRMALLHPDRVVALISQNGNAYEEGLSESWNPIQKYWRDPSMENREALRALLTPETTRWQYTHGVAHPDRIAPESYTLDALLLARPGIADIQLDLFLDYRTNVAFYPTIQTFFRGRQPPLLAVWGQNDPFFLPAGAEAFARDNRRAQVRFFDTGHFALETHHLEIAAEIRAFLNREL